MASILQQNKCILDVPVFLGFPARRSRVTPDSRIRVQEKGCGDYCTLNRKKAAFPVGANSRQMLPSTTGMPREIDDFNFWILRDREEKLELHQGALNSRFESRGRERSKELTLRRRI